MKKRDIATERLLAHVDKLIDADYDMLRVNLNQVKVALNRRLRIVTGLFSEIDLHESEIYRLLEKESLLCGLLQKR
ncbi:MAG: hypothetical protein KAS93_03480 [Gammaproteobacteria bacterium]|nr:hypothetical protein [Gammaproteobacteria bacterium]